MALLQRKAVLTVLTVIFLLLAGCTGITNSTPTPVADSGQTCPPLSEGIHIEFQNTENATYNISLRVINKYNNSVILTENATIPPNGDHRVTGVVGSAETYSVTSTASVNGTVVDTMEREWTVTDYCDSRRIVLEDGRLHWRKIPLA